MSKYKCFYSVICIAVLIAAVVSGCGRNSGAPGASATGASAPETSATGASATGASAPETSAPGTSATGAGQPAAASSFQAPENSRVSYLGPEGTYTEEAAQFFFPETASFIPETTVSVAIADVTEGKADYAVIPQENTIGGAVTNYVDALLAEGRVFVVGEVILPINQTLMGVPGASLDDIKLICSHAQGIKQSETWRTEHLPNAETREMDSTAAAASYVAETGDKMIAAVAAPGAAKLYGLDVLAGNVQITDTNKTRFYVLSAARPEGQTWTRAVFAAECEANRLDDIIIEIHNAGLELVTIHDRPEGSYLGAYRYIIEVEKAKGITEKDLQTIERIPEVRCLGAFDVQEKQMEMTENMKTIYLAGGCFWGMQKFLDQFDGVLRTEAGYANGPDEAPSYKDVCHSSGHAETVRVDYDPEVISLTDLVKYYFKVIDPLAVNQQGNDIGIQYRTGIYYTEESQLPEIEAVYQAEEEKAGTGLAVELLPLENYFPAEDYHQKYLDKNPDGYCHIPDNYLNLQKTGIEESTEELRERIGDLAFEVTQYAATEYPYTGEYDNFFEKGLYVDVVSGEPLFTSMDKYNSGCGWPAFTRPVREDALSEHVDTSHGMVRTEVRSSGANSHLGHVFDDGPEEAGGLRYCINSASIRFIPYDELEAQGYGEYRKLFE